MIDLEGILKGVEDLQFIIIHCCVDVLAVNALICTYIDKILAFIRRREGREGGKGGDTNSKPSALPPLCPFLSHTHLLSCILLLHHLPSSPLCFCTYSDIALWIKVKCWFMLACNLSAAEVQQVLRPISAKTDIYNKSTITRMFLFSSLLFSPLLSSPLYIFCMQDMLPVTSRFGSREREGGGAIREL